MLEIRASVDQNIFGCRRAPLVLVCVHDCKGLGKIFWHLGEIRPVFRLMIMIVLLKMDAGWKCL